MNTFNEEVKNVIIDEYIWVIFIIISFFNIIGDEMDKKNIIFGNNHSRKAKNIFLFTSFIGIIIYAYFIIRNYNDYVEHMNSDDINLYQQRLIGSILIFIGSILIIYFSLNVKTVYSPEVP